MKSIFLSYSSKDKFFVEKLSETFKSIGIQTWLYEAEIEPGDSISGKIEKAINEHDYFGIILSKYSINSKWVQRELKAALSKEINAGNDLIIPILIEKGITIPIFLQDKMYVDFTTSDQYDENLTKLLKKFEVKGKIPNLSNPSTVIKNGKLPKNVNQTQIFSKSQDLLDKFEDIVIEDLDVSRTYQPDERYNLNNYYFELSKLPSYEWQQIFLAERAFPRHTMWREAWIEGNFIIIYCMMDEIEKYHFNDLLSDVESTNKKFREYLLENAKKESTEITKKSREEKELNELRSKLGF